ncbi:hypothetical protein QBC46DRAFT_228470, partial [Diplogelasinospora grovesii]
MCVLCRVTFSRSNILKRYFIKCSICRGNPTSTNHLSHPQVHVKKNAAAYVEGDANHINNISNMPADGIVHPFSLIPAPNKINNLTND